MNCIFAPIASSVELGESVKRNVARRGTCRCDGGPCACRACGWDAGRFRKIYRPNGSLIEELAKPVLICEDV